MPPRRSTTKSATPSRSRSRSQSKGRGSASPRASAQATKRTSTPSARASVVFSNTQSQSPLHQEMRQVEAILANRRGKDGLPPPTRVGPSTAARNGWSYWASIIMMELLVLVWCCWAYDLYTKSVFRTA